ncbi:hypothetical protein Zm00014a_035824 [Zea mays]|uniref:Uncharacterized protein n=1 Tax=Zea mays TaxID=4577 RepID=A0A317YKP1_MAIZE|nr:hypothetical protein Zm00014a_035824 [Zea mays]
MRKGAASARGSGITTPAQRNLLSARPNSDLAAAELQKDGSELQGGGLLSAAATHIRPLPPPEGENY